MRSKDDMKTEVHALWTAVRGEQPVDDTPPVALLEALIRGLDAPDYTVIRRWGVISPFDAR